MATFNKIRLFVWHWHFSRELKKPRTNRKMSNVEQSLEVGILFDSSEKSNYNIVYKYIKQLQDQNKRVKALGFVNDVKIPHYCHPRLSFDYLTLSDLNWYYIPNSKFVNDFMNSEFDILINFDIEDNMHLRYVAGTSIAKFKVGIFGEQNDKVYDLMIKTKDDAGVKEYIQEISHYLNLLKSSNK